MNCEEQGVAYEGPIHERFQCSAFLFGKILTLPRKKVHCVLYKGIFLGNKYKEFVTFLTEKKVRECRSPELPRIPKSFYCTV